MIFGKDREGEATPIPQAVDMSCEIWEARLKQENPDLGPVTLIYSDGPMFVDPYTSCRDQASHVSSSSLNREP
jgi:hypothetical protein